jgi:N-glycosylase/DNA lyase
MCLTEEELFDKVLLDYTRCAKAFFNSKKWNDMSEEELWRELCLCILSSNLPYEMAQSSTSHLANKGYLNLTWIVKTRNSQKLIANELSKPIYLPRRVDGSFRKYRFPNQRAKDIYRTASLVASKRNWLKQLLQTPDSEREVRNALVRHLSGVGLKQASHFLRNIGYSKRLAIIDSHVVSFLEGIGAVSDKNLKTITRKAYIELEGLLEKICDKHGLDLAVFDMAIWNYMHKRRT